MRDDKIVAGLIQRDEHTICYIIEKYSRLLWTVADAILKNVGNEQDVEESVADVFIALWEHPEQFDPRKGHLKSWLCILARSKALDRYRKLSKVSTVSIDDVMLIGRMGVQDYIIREETKQELSAALDTLTDTERNILIRRYYYEQKPKDIAVALDLPVKQIDNYLYRSKQKLRAAVSRQGGMT